MKKLLLFIALSFACAICVVGFSACGQSKEVIDVTQADLISAEGFSADENEWKIVVSNDVETFSFSDKITVNKGARWTLCKDAQGSDIYYENAVPVAEGNNTVYLLVISADENTAKTYKFIIYRKCLYTVHVNDGSGREQQVEEGGFVVKPDDPQEILGRTFIGWDYDFTKPVDKSLLVDNFLIIEPIWEDKPEMANFTFYSDPTFCVITRLKNTAVKETVVPDYVTSIGDFAFKDCSGLTSITISDSVTSIGDGAFYGCSGLTSITIPDSVTSIGYSAFCNCSSLTSITIPDGVTSIGSYAFSRCSSLTSITIPDSVTSIGDYAFYNCSGLTSITFKGTKSEWLATRNGEDLWHPIVPSNCVVHCKDGDFR